MSNTPPPPAGGSPQVSEVTPRQVEILPPARLNDARAPSPGGAAAGAPGVAAAANVAAAAMAGATPLGLARWRLALAFAVALVSDVLTLAFAWAPPVEWAIDVATAGLLFVILGWRWWLLPGLIVEAVPGLQAFPFWLLVVAAIAATGKISSKLAPPASPK